MEEDLSKSCIVLLFNRDSAGLTASTRGLEMVCIVLQEAARKSKQCCSLLPTRRFFIYTVEKQKRPKVAGKCFCAVMLTVYPPSQSQKIRNGLQLEIWGRCDELNNVRHCLCSVSCATDDAIPGLWALS